MKRMISIMLLIFSLFILFSCSDDNTALLYSLANETETPDNSLDNKVTISAMVHDGSDYYVSAGGSIWSRDDGSLIKLWESVTLPSGAAYCTAMTLFSGNLYAGFLMGNDTYAFYSAAPSLTPGWSAVTDVDIDGKQILQLSDVNGNLFVSTKDGSDYMLYYSPDGSDDSFADTTFPTQTKPVLDVVYDGALNYFAITGAKIFYGNAANNISTEETTNTPSPSADFGGLFFDGSLYYLSNKGGVVYSNSVDPADATWTHSATKTVDKNVPFTSFGKVGTKVMVGTEGYGFYEMSDGNVTSLSRLEALTAAELYNGWVTGFLLDGARVFVFTAGSGLWNGVYKAVVPVGERNWDWTHE